MRQVLRPIRVKDRNAAAPATVTGKVGLVPLASFVHQSGWEGGPTVGATPNPQAGRPASDKD
jgi:hypothetical protein